MHSWLARLILLLMPTAYFFGNFFLPFENSRAALHIGLICERSSDNFTCSAVFCSLSDAPVDPVYLALKQATGKYGGRRGSSNNYDSATPSPGNLSQVSLQVKIRSVFGAPPWALKRFGSGSLWAIRLNGLDVFTGLLMQPPDYYLGGQHCYHLVANRFGFRLSSSTWPKNCKTFFQQKLMWGCFWSLSLGMHLSVYSTTLTSPLSISLSHTVQGLPHTAGSIQLPLICAFCLPSSITRSHKSHERLLPLTLIAFFHLHVENASSHASEQISFGQHSSWQDLVPCFVVSELSQRTRAEQHGSETHLRAFSDGYLIEVALFCWHKLPAEAFFVWWWRRPRLCSHHIRLATMAVSNHLRPQRCFLFAADLTFSLLPLSPFPGVVFYSHFVTCPTYIYVAVP